MDWSKITNPREASFLAISAALAQESFIADSLELWREMACPTIVDFHLAQRIAYGTVQMILSLDAQAQLLAKNKKINLKTREKIILRMALYQRYYLEKIPLYAIVDESLKIAKKYCHVSFVSFLNAVLRKSNELILTLPEGRTSKSLSIKYSYPEIFIKALIEDYGTEQTEEILKVQNLPSIIMARIRNREASLHIKMSVMGDIPFQVCIIEDREKLSDIINSANYYVQNITPVSLMAFLSRSTARSPKRILDLCASPGGKLIAVHDLFPSAELYANDVSEKKVQRLQQNCLKYGINAHVTCMPGENYSTNLLFDLIMIDAPCSNTGVLNKRPEARWRLSEESLFALEQLQMKLIEHAINLLSEQGELWYMTCSIMKRENEKIAQQACSRFGLSIIEEKTFLPTSNGYDGGYGCKLGKNV